MKDVLIDYNDITFEKLTLELELNDLSDDVLLDECNFILSGKYESRIMDDLLTTYFKTGKINRNQRKIAEGLYLLAHGDLAWEV